MFGIKFKIQKPVVTDPDKIDEILTRGVLKIVDKENLKEKLLSGERLRIKFGIDPTSPALHIGRAVILLKLKDFQDLGHIVVIIVGDTTGIIGDTSDKESERPQISEERLKENSKTYFEQVGKVLDINTVEKHFNSEWLSKLTYNEIGEHADQFSVADFIARENIKKRLDGGKRVSLREVLYPLLQGYDSVAVKADVELGGNDQWFNLLAGRKLQVYFNQKPQDIVTMNLILGTDGRKMSSSWGNTINLTDSPEDMYGKVMSIPDELITTYFINCTRVAMNRISEIEKKIKDGSNPRDLKMELARAIVGLYYTDKEAQIAEEIFINTFQKRSVSDVMEVFYKEGETHRDVVVREGIVSSGNEFNRLVAGGALSLTTTKQILKDPMIIATNGTYKLGKRRFYSLRKK